MNTIKKIGHEILDSDLFPVLSVLFLVLAVICLLGSVVLFVINRYTRVSRDNVPVIKGTFAVNPNKTGTVATDCGSNNDQPCVYNAPNIATAIDHCNTYKTGCTAFVYDYTIHQAKILTDTPIVTISASSDIYYRQVASV